MPITGGGGGIISYVASAIDPATTAWVAQVVANGGSVSAGRQATVNNLIVSIKAASVWTKLDRLWIYAAENTPSALTDMVGLALSTVVGSPAFVTDRGYTGVDSPTPSDYIDTGFNPSTAGGNSSQDSAHISAWGVTNVQSGGGGSGWMMGASAVTETNIIPRYTTDATFFRINDGTGSGGNGANADSRGHFIANRSGASASQGYINGSSFATPNQASGTVPSLNIYTCAQNVANVGTNGCGVQLAMASIGGSLSGTEVLDFYNALRTYMTAVGVP